jgi:coenzyme Q-binding protein COQ10
VPKHRETRRLPYTPEQLFDLVADVGNYPEFLPWVVATRVRSKTESEMVADMVVGFRMFRETFTSRVVLERPTHIHVDYLNGPLKFLYNDWKFAPADGGTDIDFCVEFEFKQRLFETLAGAFFQEAFRRMVAAFEERAATVYASESGSSSSRAQRTA